MMLGSVGLAPEVPVPSEHHCHLFIFLPPAISKEKKLPAATVSEEPKSAVVKTPKFVATEVMESWLSAILLESF